MQTLLEKFFEDKINQHTEPIRVNVPRGQKMGMSKAKYQAALITSLTNSDLKSVVKSLGGSYEVIRRWRAEKQFKETCSELLEEFIWSLKVELDAIAAEMQRSHIKGYESFDLGSKLEMFSDAGIYHLAVLESLEKWLKNRTSNKNEYFIFFEIIHFLASSSGCPRIGRLLTQAKEGLRESVIDKAIEVINNPEATKSEREEVVELLQKIKL